MSKIRILNSLGQAKLKTLTRQVKTHRYLDGKVVVHENDQGSSLFFVKQGIANIVKGGNVIRQISKFDYFGERSIILGENRSATVIANGPLEVYELSKVEFEAVVNAKVRE